MITIEDMCSLMANKALSCLGMTAPKGHMNDTETLAVIVHTNVPQLNQQQRIAYDTLIEAMKVDLLEFASLMLPEGLKNVHNFIVTGGDQNELK